jgi:hypothetical protein
MPQSDASQRMFTRLFNFTKADFPLQYWQESRPMNTTEIIRELDKPIEQLQTAKTALAQLDNSGPSKRRVNAQCQPMPKLGSVQL